MLSNQQNFLQFKEIFSLTVYQINVYLIQRNRFLGVVQKKVFPPIDMINKTSFITIFSLPIDF